MKISIPLLISLFVLFSPSVNAFVFFAFKKDNCHYETKAGMLHGAFSQKYSNGSIMVSGKFENNQRVGTWNFYNFHGQLIEKRMYFNNYEYAIMNQEGKILKQFNVNGKWDLIKSKNVKFQHRLWKLVEKESEGHLEIDKLVKSINNCDSGNFFSEERFIHKIDKTELANITAIKIKEDYIYDNERESMFVRTLGIGLVNSNSETVAWIYYPDWMESFKKVKTTWHNDHLNRRTLHDVFTQRAYNAKPYKLGKDKLKSKSIIELELEMVHQENMLIIAKA